jgi:hypothetical protein
MYYADKIVDVRFWTRQTIQTGANQPVSTDTYLRPSPQQHNQRVGQSVKGWVDLIANRRDATSDYIHETWDSNSNEGSIQFNYLYKVTNTVVASALVGNLTMFDTWPSLYSGDISKINDAALTQFLSRAYRAQTSFQGGVFLGELKEAVHMIRHPLDSLVNGMLDYLKALRRRKGRGRKSASAMLKMISGTWLEYVFGWGPLLSDIDAGAKALARAVTYRAPTEHVVGSASKTERTIGSQRIFSPDNQYLYYWYRPVTNWTVEVKYEGGVYAYPQGNAGTLADFGLGFQSFAPTVWELIPFSFLVDYVSNVGQFIEALSFCQSDLIYCSRIVTSKCQMTPGGFDRQNNIETDTNFKILLEQCNFGNTMLKGSSYTRSRVVPGTLIPSLGFTLQNLNFRRGANIGALGAAAASTSKFLRN